MDKNSVGRFNMSKLGACWIGMGPLARAIGHAVPMKRPAIMVISLPRSGSTWVGNVIASHPETVFLHEPVTKHCLDLKPGPSYFYVDKNEPPALFDQKSRDAFHGIPLFSRSYRGPAEQWNIFTRRQKRLLIKEVNPLAMEYWLAHFSFMCLLLIRHPAAVAASASKLGWTEGTIDQRFPKESPELDFFDPKHVDADYWTRSGAVQAYVIKKLGEIGRESPNCRLFQYEDLCSDPIGEFKKVFEFTQLDFAAEAKAFIEETTSDTGQAYKPGSFTIRRRSSEMIDSWRKHVDASDLDKLRDAYLAYDPPFYHETRWWESKAAG